MRTVPPVLSPPQWFGRGPAIVLGLWTCVYGALAVLTHLTLRTNAYDLSVFDYALWSTAHGWPGYVPFFGHSLFAEHFMPTLAFLLPLHYMTPTPWVLLGAQLAVTLAAALLFLRLIPAPVSNLGRIALLLAFLFSRRSHSTFTSFFYIESFEPALVLMAVLAAETMKWRKLYWLCVVAALGCKEDMALYVAAYGILMTLRSDRKRGFLTAAVAVVWLAVATLVVIPRVRAADGLPPDNPFVARYVGDTRQSVGNAAASRLFSTRSIGKVASLTGSTGYLCWIAPSWLLVTVPGIALNLAAHTDALQAGLIGHYLWPILPWVFLAAAAGASRLCLHWRRVSTVAFIAVLVVTVADAPAPRQLWTIATRGDIAASSAIRRALESFDVSKPVAAMPNLLPHLPHSMRVSTLGRGASTGGPPMYVLLSRQGDLWPFSPQSLSVCLDALERRQDFEQRSQGELIVFVRRPALITEPALPHTCFN